MSKVDLIYAELVKGRPSSEVYKEFGRSSGPFFEAIKRVTEEKLREFNEVRAELAQVTILLGEAQGNLQGTEQLRLSLSDQVGELRELLKSLKNEEQVARSVLVEFDRAGLPPNVALTAIRERVDMTAENDQLAHEIGAKSKEVAELDRAIEFSEVNLKGWQRRVEIERSKVTFALATSSRALAAQQQDITMVSQQKIFLNCEVNRLSKVLAELEPKVAGSMDEAKQVADRMRKMRRHLPKLQFLHDDLTTNIARLTQASETMAANIMSMGEKIIQVLNAENEREVRVDKKFAEKIATQNLAYEKFIELGEVEVERKLRELAGDGMARLPFIMERVETGRLELIALGTQKGGLVAEIRTLEERKAAFKNAIPGLLAVA